MHAEGGVKVVVMATVASDPDEAEVVAAADDEVDVASVVPGAVLDMIYFATTVGRDDGIRLLDDTSDYGVDSAMGRSSIVSNVARDVGFRSMHTPLVVEKVRTVFI